MDDRKAGVKLREILRDFRSPTSDMRSPTSSLRSTTLFDKFYYICQIAQFLDYAQKCWEVRQIDSCMSGSSTLKEHYTERK